ncbi:MAG: DUF4097 family beta strand repeat-containing protein [Candidatus Eisenbacteria bacterium]
MILLSVLATVTLVTATPATATPATDTTFAVGRATRLSLENYMGGVTVATWSRDAVRVRASHRRSVTVAIERTPGRLELSAEGKWGVPGSVDWDLTVPVWMAATIEGVGTDVTVEGMQGELKIDTVKGDVSVTRCFSAEASSVEGTVSISECRGRVDAQSVNESVHVRRCKGEVNAESVNGDVIVESPESHDVQATSVNGEVIMSGPFLDGGSYALSAHNGDIVVGMPEHANVSVSVSTYGGGLSADFPLTFTEKRKGREYRFTLGTGAASLALESFQGQVRLMRLDSWNKELQRLQSESQSDRDNDKDSDDDEEDK